MTQEEFDVAFAAIVLDLARQEREERENAHYGLGIRSEEAN